MPYPDDLFRRLDIDDREDTARVRDVASRYGIRLVVVDSFRGAHGGDENNSRIARGLQYLAEVAEQTKAAVHLIHHTGKLSDDAELTANSGRGSNAFLAMVRCLVGIDHRDADREHGDRSGTWCGPWHWWDRPSGTWVGVV